MPSSEARKKMRRAKLGRKNPNYGDGKSHERGYITVPAPQKGPGGRREYLHRVVTNAGKGEAVHHKDHNRAHDSGGNLQKTRNHAGRKGGEHRMPRPK